MFLLMVIIFILGYVAIALEHPLRVDKAASALLIGVLTWALYALNAENILNLGYSPGWEEAGNVAKDIIDFILPQYTYENDMPSHLTHSVEMVNDPLHFVKAELGHHLVEIAEILFFLLGAMTIVETVDQYQGFKVITDKIKTTKKVKLLWILSVLTFFMSAALDNLTTTIVLVALIRKLIDDQKTRWFFASVVVIAANAGGAWSPIGDVTTIMLWVKGNVTTVPIITSVLLPSIATMIVPLVILTFTVTGHVERPDLEEEGEDYTSSETRLFMLILGVAVLLFVPVFKTFTHLPPYLGMLLGLGFVWLVTEFIIRDKEGEDKRRLSIIFVLKKIDVPTIFFFMGILIAVAALQSAGHLDILAKWLDGVTSGNIYVINLAIGVLSSIVDNVPLVAGAMGMYEIASPDAIGKSVDFMQDGVFWQFLAYCAGTGGSILIVGSAAGVAAMGMERIDFVWYLKNMSLLALIGYIAGAGVFYLQSILI